MSGRRPLPSRSGANRLSDVTVTARRAWLVTFTDLISLMLAFFVMLFAMSGVKVELWEATVSSLTSTLRPAPVATPPPSEDESVSTRAADPPAIDLDYLAAVMGGMRDDAPALADSRLSRITDGLIVTTDVDRLFLHGRAELSPAALDTLAVVVGVLRNIGNRIGVRVEAGGARAATLGHRPAFALALARSAAVANALREAGYDRSVVAYGVGGGGVGGSERRGRGAGDRLEIVILPEGEAR